MVDNYRRNELDEERRDFLKALGVTGAVIGGGVTLEEARSAMESEAVAGTAAVADAGAGIRADLDAGALDLELLAGQQAAFAEAATAVPDLARSEPPAVGAEPPAEAFMPMYESGWPAYEHLLDAGFFETAAEHLPRYTPEFLGQLTPRFVASAAVAEPLADLGLDDKAGADLVATVAGNAEHLADHHWVATDEINRERFEGAEFIPSATQGVSGGALLWLESLDHHLWTHAGLLTDAVHENAIWHGQSLAAGFDLVVESAREAAGDASRGEALSDADLGAMAGMGFAVQAIAGGLLPKDVYWFTEEMRAPRAESGVELSAATNQ